MEILRKIFLKKNSEIGFTLIELLIGFAILAFMVVMSIGIINSIGITNKGRDARRKKDLKNIKISLEEYFNDKGKYPEGDLLRQINNGCGSNIDGISLKPWPCDPSGGTYEVIVSNSKNAFKALTNLENQSDKEIPSGWYSKDPRYKIDSYTIYEVNYGVSSTNIMWYDVFYDYVKDCEMSVCYSWDGPQCNSAGSSCNGNNCYYKDKIDVNNNCDSYTSRCKTNSCPN